MNANLCELSCICAILSNHKIECRGIIHANYGCSDYQLQYRAFGLEFYLERSKLEASCTNRSNIPLRVFVKSTNPEAKAFYELLK